MRVCPSNPVHTVYEKETYKLVERVKRDGGVFYDEVEHEYKITPEYVASFAESADYHSDINAAIAQCALTKRQNLGDIRDIQAIMNMDDTALNALNEQVNETLAKAEAIKAEYERLKAVEEAKQAQAQAQAQG